MWSSIAVSCLVTNCPTAIILIDSNSVVKQWSNKCGTLFGWNSHEAVGKYLYDLIIPPKFQQAHVHAMKRFQKTDSSKLLNNTDGVVLSALHKNGSEFPIVLNISNYVDGNQQFFVGFIQDLSEQQKQRLALEESQKVIDSLNKLLQNIPFAFGLYELSTSKLIYTNSKLSVFTNRFVISDKEFFALIDQLTSEIKCINDFHEKSTGNYYDCFFQKTMFEAKEHIVVCATDVTNRIMAEKKSQILREQEQTRIIKEKQKNQLFSNLSHDSFTPLNGIIGSIDILINQSNQSQYKIKHVEYVKQGEQEDHTDYLQIIKHSASLLNTTLQQIFEAAQISNPYAVKLNSQSIHLLDLLNSVGSVYRYNLNNENVKFVCKFDDTLQNIEILCDKNKLSLIMMNLTQNAIKFTHTGSVSLTANLKVMENVTKFHFCVQDTGKGISKEVLPTIFQGFCQEESSVNRSHSGIGLGLYIAQKYAKLLGGEITVQSKKNIGSNFSFEFPVNISKTIVNKTVNQYDSKLFNILKHENVLIVDDNKINQKVLSKMLEQTNCKITMASNGQEAVDLFMLNKYKIIFMDLQMPVLNGYDATSNIRKLDKNVPIIAVTAFDLPEEQDKCKAVGMNDFLAKPVMSQHLFSAICNVLQKN